ncbi:MAG TPA: N,N-dimethylformamidase beta subunit family domain-containing protein, partial [Rhizomicrobium sp.]|nr:N,N-dimethylformamidase beta subunit family domain-containing protein [Rhizomicrobium sp.]
MFRMPPVDRETTEARAAKDFDLLSTINGYPEDFSVFEGEPLFIRCARKPARTLPLPRRLVRVLWRFRFGEAIRARMLKRVAHSHRRNVEKPAAWVTRLALRDPIGGKTVLERKLSTPTPLFSEMPASYRDSGADYTSRIPLETAGLPAGVYECVVRDDRGNASQDIFVNIKPRSLENTDLLCVLPSFTWQAYNRIGGGSFYSPELGHQRTICSQRPMHHHSDNSIAPTLALLSTFREHGLNVACVDSWDLHRGRCPAGKVPVAAILVHEEYCS